jgi:ATPase subunit of ABC transporter with duplicated ATPase domains
VVGNNNGCGKSTLINLITGELPGKDGNTNIPSGRIWRHANIRFGHVSQYSVEEMEQKYGHLTVMEYAEQYLERRRGTSQVMTTASSHYCTTVFGSLWFGWRTACSQSYQDLVGWRTDAIVFWY